MKSRKSFLAALASAGAVSLLAGNQNAEGASSAAPTPVPVITPTAAVAEKKPSALARAFAEKMREFDPRLSDAQVAQIARDTDYNIGVGKNLNPTKHPLQNSDAPLFTTAFDG